MDQGSTPIHNVGVDPATATTGIVPTFSSRRRSRGVAVRDNLGSMLFVVPYLLFFIAFTAWPLVYAFWISLRNWNTVGGDKGFVGLSHYYNLIFNYAKFDEVQIFWQSIVHVALFAVISVPLVVALALIFALLLVNAPWMSLFRAIFYMPAVLSVAVAMTIWLWILQNGGVLSTYLHSNIPWLIEQPWAWVSIILATLWWTPGFNMVVLLAGLLDIPSDYYEAAKIDGASGWDSFWHITMPLLRPVLAFVTITQMIASFGLFGQVFILTRNLASVTPVALAMYNEAFTGTENLALAAAMSFVLGIILIVLAVAQLRFFRATEM